MWTIFGRRAAGTRDRLRTGRLWTSCYSSSVELAGSRNGLRVASESVVKAYLPCDIDVRISQGKEPRHVGVIHGMPLLAQGGQGRVVSAAASMPFLLGVAYW